MQIRKTYKDVKPDLLYDEVRDFVLKQGAIIDEAVLVKALQQGWIRGAGIDAFEKEPTAVDNPLLKMNNVIVTPHALAWTDEMFLNQWTQILSQISQIIHGEMPEALVNKDVWEKPEFQARLRRFLSATN